MGILAYIRRPGLASRGWGRHDHRTHYWPCLRQSAVADTAATPEFSSLPGGIPFDTVVRPPTSLIADSQQRTPYFVSNNPSAVGYSGAFSFPVGSTPLTLPPRDYLDNLTIEFWTRPGAQFSFVVSPDSEAFLGSASDIPDSSFSSTGGHKTFFEFNSWRYQDKTSNDLGTHLGFTFWADPHATRRTRLPHPHRIGATRRFGIAAANSNSFPSATT